MMIYAFGICLFLGLFVAAFLVWREARQRGMAEEKVFDVFLLSIFLGIIVGRIGYIGADLTRILFIFKYPGISFNAALIGAGVTAALSSWSLGLPWLLMLDLLAYGLIFASIFGYLGLLNLPLAGLFVAAGVLAAIISKKLRSEVALADLARRHGIFLICYLLFQSLSLLILEASLSRVYYLAGILALVAVFFVRYRELISYFGHAISQKRPFANFRLFGRPV